jgi:hypothetical protein
MNRKNSALSVIGAVAVMVLSTASQGAVIRQDSFDNNGVAASPDNHGGDYSYTYTNAERGSFSATGTGKIVFG